MAQDTGSPRSERSPLDDLEGQDPFGSGDDPFGGGLPFSEDDPPMVMMTKLWISQNPLLSVGAAFAAGTLIGALKR